MTTIITSNTTTIALAGGGTAGHVMPNLALVPAMKKRFGRVVYLGGEGMEKELAPRAGVPFYSTKTVKLEREHLLKNVKIPFALIKGKQEAKEILIKEHVSLVFGKGGYASLPACLAARSLGIPIVIHESDYTMGVANKLISRFADLTLTSFPETAGGEYVGNPVREELFQGDPERARFKYRLSDKPSILIFGGSQGAEAINKAVYSAAPELSRTHNVIHIAGKKIMPLKLSGYTQIEFANDINDLFAVSELVVIRGGANSLAEAAALGKRTLCIPLPKGNSRGDQEDNAQSYQKRGLIKVLPQTELNGETLISAIKELLKMPPPPAVKNDANLKIIDKIARFIH